MLLSQNCDFDAVIDRRETNSVKWDFCCSGTDDVLPMWVADMDFKAPLEVVEAVSSAAAHGIYGYSELPSGYYDAVTNWLITKHMWSVQPEWISYSPGVITALNIAIQTFTRPGDHVILQSPVYPPFFSSVVNNGRHVLNNQLICDRGEYSIDFDHLEKLVNDRTRMLVLCSPHNPVGRVWRESELTRLAEFVLRHDLMVFTDEIHCDLVLSGSRHIPFASLGAEVAAKTIVGMAPSKTFNIAGLKASVIITPNRHLKKAFDQAQERVFGLYAANSFAIPAAEAAYRHGRNWLNNLMKYLHSNYQFAKEHLASYAPDVVMSPLEGTFLLWLDFTSLGLQHEELTRFIQNEAKIALNDGMSFGPGGEQHMRMNIGCPLSVIKEGLTRLTSAISQLEKRV